MCDSAAGRAGSEAFSASLEVKNALKELQYRIEESRGQDLRAQALRPPLSLIRGLERFVVDESRDCYDRAMAWFYLVSTWGVLRFDDHRGVHPVRMILNESGLTFDLERTKTTGSGKAQQCRTVHVDPEAFVSEADWLAVGFSSFLSMGFVNRDYALVCKGVRETIIQREISYEEYVGHLRRIASQIELGTNRLVTVPRIVDDERTFGSALSGLLTAHSWRAFLPTAASGLGAAQSDLDALGSWRPKGGMVYVRQNSARALKYQKAVATSLRNGVADFLNEAAEMRVYERRLLQRGFSDTEVEEALEGVFAVPRGEKVQEGDSAGLLTGSCSGAALASDHRAVVALPSTAETVAVARSKPKTAGERSAPKIPDGEVGYVISLVRKGRRTHKKLHYLGQCHLVPGVDYLRYEWIGPQRPGVEFYDSVCIRCWPVKDVGEDDATSSNTEEADHP